MERKFADYILKAFFSFKIVGQDLFTCGLLIKSNWTLAILLFFFLGLPVFCTLAWVVAGGLHSRLFFCLMPVRQGGQTFLTCWLCSDLQIKSLASSSASKAAVLSRWHIVLLSATNSLLTILDLLYSWSHISLWFRTLHLAQNIYAVCQALLLSLSQVAHENERANRSSCLWPTCLRKGAQKGSHLLQHEVQTWARC